MYAASGYRLFEAESALQLTVFAVKSAIKDGLNSLMVSFGSIFILMMLPLLYVHYLHSSGGKLRLKTAQAIVSGLHIYHRI